MANMCYFCMHVKGDPENIKEFYESMSHKSNVYMGRGAWARISYDYDKCTATIDGECKWSVKLALIDNAVSMRKEPELWSFGDVENRDNLEFITLYEACKKWGLDMEVYSEENGCKFQEHFQYMDGRVVCEECVDRFECYVEDYDSKEAAEEDCGVKFTDEEWLSAEDGYIHRGGFESWDFEI